MAKPIHLNDNPSNYYIYTGGRAPQYITNVLIHPSVDTIDKHAFCDNPNLRTVQFHPGVDTIGREAFMNCRSIQFLDLSYVRVVGVGAFTNCKGLKKLLFGKQLEIIEFSAFYGCTSIKYVVIPHARTIESCAFNHCTALTHVSLPETLEKLGDYAFWACNLQRVATPFLLHDEKLSDSVFDSCRELSRVDLIGEQVHKTIQHLFMDCWRYDMYADIYRINQILPQTGSKTKVIQQWMESVQGRLGYYRGAHGVMLNEAMVILELALWKAKVEESRAQRYAVGNDADVKQEARIKCGASIVIKNVLPFLNLN